MDNHTKKVQLPYQYTANIRNSKFHLFVFSYRQFFFAAKHHFVRLPSTLFGFERTKKGYTEMYPFL
jgi:hypothetical protein